MHHCLRCRQLCNTVRCNAQVHQPYCRACYYEVTHEALQRSLTLRTECYPPDHVYMDPAGYYPCTCRTGFRCLSSLNVSQSW